MYFTIDGLDFTLVIKEILNIGTCITSVNKYRRIGGFLMKPEKKERIVLTNVIETELDILKRHVLVLQTLKQNEPAGIIRAYQTPTAYGTIFITDTGTGRTYRTIATGCGYHRICQ
jgi:hypothetical protein